MAGERDLLGAQLVRRNDELALLYHKTRLQQSALAQVIPKNGSCAQAACNPVTHGLKGRRTPACADRKHVLLHINPALQTFHFIPTKETATQHASDGSEIMALSACITWLLMCRRVGCGGQRTEGSCTHSDALNLWSVYCTCRAGLKNKHVHHRFCVE